MIDLVNVDVFDDTKLTAVDTPHGRFAVAKVEDSYYLFANSCTHASCPLSEGMLSGSVLTCDCHFSDFDVTTGRVLTEPAETDLKVMEITPDGDILRVEEARLAELGV